MASPASLAPLFSDLRGVTVRNTFLEFDDLGRDSFPESGFARQASEPAKPLHRQVSEQTTAGSGATVEESTTEPDEGYTQLAAYLSSGLPRAAAARPRASTAPGPSALQAPAGQAVMRFCPNCGAEAEPNHRFCPYCCFALQQPGAGGGGEPGVGAAPPPQAQPLAGTDSAVPSPSAPNLLAYLRRFRYVEACSSDVELARVLCLNYMQTGKAA